MGINYIIRIMHNYPQNDIFLYHNLKLHKMIEMHSKFDNMHTNRIFNALICINNHVNSCTNCMLSSRIHTSSHGDMSFAVVLAAMLVCDIKLIFLI